jgi:hypothetical protein
MYMMSVYALYTETYEGLVGFHQDCFEVWCSDEGGQKFFCKERNQKKKLVMI